MSATIKTNMKNIVLHCQRFQYRYQFDEKGNVTAPAIKEKIGQGWTIDARVRDLHPEVIGEEIFGLWYNDKIGEMHYVIKVTHNGREIPFSFNFCNDIAEGLYGPSY